MTRLVRGHEARGSVTLVNRIDLRAALPGHRAAATAALVDQLDTGSTVELVLPDLDDEAAAITGHVAELLHAGVHVKLVAPPGAHAMWLSRTLQIKAADE